MLRVTMTAAAMGLAALAMPAGTASADGGYWDSPRSAYGHRGHVRSYHYVEKHYYHRRHRPRWRGRRSTTIITIMVPRRVRERDGTSTTITTMRHGLDIARAIGAVVRIRSSARCSAAPRAASSAIRSAVAGGNRIATATGALLGLAVGNSIGRRYDCY